MSEDPGYFSKAMKRRFLLIIVSICLTHYLFSQGVVINEVMSSNLATITDEDGDFTDWIELYNTSDSAINLVGMSLTDDQEDLQKWTFPNCLLAGNEYLLIFASDKDRKDGVGHWETVIDWGDVWKYTIGNSEIPENWFDIGFNDTNWAEGSTGIGYGDGDDATIVPNGTISVYMRKVFDVENYDSVIEGILHVDYDDAFVAYLNGVEIARANITGESPSFDQTADSYTEAKIYRGEYPDGFQIENACDILQDGDNLLAIQVHRKNTPR